MYQDTISAPLLENNIILQFWLLLLGVVAFCFIMGAVMYQLEPKASWKSKAKWKYSLIISVPCVIAVAFVVPSSFAQDNQLEEARDNVIAQNVEKLEENIKLKYSVDNVEGLDSLSSYTEGSYGYSEEDAKLGFDVVVHIGDKRVNYTLQQDPETFEPTLINPIIDGGDKAAGGPDAKDLLKESN